MDYLSPDEVGSRFKVSKWTVRRWIEAGRLPAARIGRRWLIPLEFIERLEAEHSRPDEARDDTCYVLARGPAPRYGYFENPWTEPELDRLCGSLISAIRAGGWPYDTFRLKKEGIKMILRGKMAAPPGLWRYLVDGIERLRAAAHSGGKEDDQTDQVIT
jgi:excisionase family DNA binding protein